MKQAWLSVALIVILAVAIAAIGVFVSDQRRTLTEAVPKVKVTPAVIGQVVDFEDYIGRFEASESVEVRSPVGGMLEKVHFRDGQAVRKGDLLFEIDPRVEQAELDMAEANTRRAEGRLSSVSAALASAKQLQAQGNLGQNEFDRIAEDGDLARANLAVSRVKQEYARAKLESARIKASIDGTIGHRLVDPGTLIKADKMTLAVIVKFDPMYVDFDVDERTFLKIRRMLIREGEIDPKRGSRLPILVSLGSEDDYPYRGQADFSYGVVSPETGTVHLHAALNNTDLLLMPGISARIRVVMSVPHEALLIPEVSLLSDRGQKLVYVVNNRDIVESRPVRLGALSRGMRVVQEGLAAGDRIVVEQDVVRPGMTVKPFLTPRPVALPSP